MNADAWDLSGNWVIEASAGTGKTYTITTLVCRLVAEQGVPIRQLLVTTFTNAAASELRVRVRERLRSVLLALDHTAGASASDDDALVARWRADAATKSLRRDRLRQALQQLDEASITTIHGFCQRALQELPFEAGTDIGRTMQGDASALVDAATADGWAEAMSDLTDAEVPLVVGELPPEIAPAIVRGALAHRDLPVVPEARDAAQRTAAVHAAHAEVRRLMHGLDIESIASKFRAASKTARQLRAIELAPADGSAAQLAAWRAQLHGVEDLGAEHFEKALRKDFASSSVAARQLAERLQAVRDALDGAAHQSMGAIRARLAVAARRSAEVRKRRERTMTFDDMVQDMRCALQGPSADALVQAVRGRYRVALVDEFQDTDRVQCEIFERLFGAEGSSVSFVGDPKQSIYLFRGADIGAYLAATSPPRFRGERASLVTSFRSDRALVDAVQALLEVEPGGTLGGSIGDMAGIKLPRLEAKHERARLLSRDGSAASGLRVLHGEPDANDPGRLGQVGIEAVAARVAEAIRRELDDGLTINDGGNAPRRLVPADMAVLLAKGSHIELLQQALRDKGIPTVTRSRQSVWESDESADLERVLRAAASPANLGRRRGAGTTEAAGLSSDEVRARGKAADGAALEALAEWLLDLRRELDAYGPVACVRRMLENPALPGQEPGMLRLLARTGGERSVTNFLHLGELLAQSWREGVRSPEELAARMVVARTESASEPVTDLNRQQRVESEGSAVELLTIHGAKGLEWPVVWLPSYALSQGERAPTDLGALPLARDGCTVLAVGGAPLDAAIALRVEEERREQFRLLYVALTRAKHRCNLVWVPSHNGKNARTPLGALLHGRAEAGWKEATERALGALRSVATMSADLRALVDRAQQGGLRGAVSLEPLPHATACAWTRPTAGAALVAARSQRAPLPSAARTTSFSGLTRDAHEVFVEARVRTDDAQGDEAAATGRAADAPLLSRHVLPAGPRYGDLVHRILEEGLAHVGTEKFAACVDRACRADGLIVDAGPLADGLRSMAGQALLGGASRGVELGGATLRDLGAGLSRSELEYLLPAGSARNPVLLRSIAQALAMGGEVAQRYADVVPTLGGSALHGHLMGFIDLVCEHRGRWYIVDYKTNALGTALDAFAPDALDDAMVSSHYVLQYHLYALAVHRWLRTRLRAYRYEEHFGGALYLFVRAMGASRPAGSGVYADRPERTVIDALDAAFGGRCA